ncbi:unnamed protein product [Brachionus calyciflorus]|uniref:Methyltransferase FkbM domain-containing protein n=1 Tax=Brachionus calyciflorus TaxID=104777 RepID=A0A813WQE6_9BILA|nr:unnamed protein product [Brachionus calyciflorus]
MIKYKTIFAYCMAIMYLSMHFIVSFTSIDTNIKRDNVKILNFKSKKLLNYDENVLINKLKTQSHIRLEIKPQGLRIDGVSQHKKYNLKNTTQKYYSQIQQDKIVSSLLNISNGLFVEAGAYDGETHSNTLYLERFKNWTGLLIEPSMENYKILLSKNRKAYSINSCLSSGNKSRRSRFIEAGPFGVTTNQTTTTDSYNVLCHPLEKILDYFFKEIKRNDRIIDYMSLDIEGNEKSVLESFNWSKYKFKLLTIEYNQNVNFYNWVKKYLDQFGYVEIVVDDVWYQDVYLAHSSFFNNFNLTKVSDYILV